MWLQFASNKKAIEGIFGDTPLPSLNDLMLRQVVMNLPFDFAASFEAPKYPTPPPRAWREKNFDSLQIRIRATVTKLRIIADLSAESDVTLSLTSKLISLSVLSTVFLEAEYENFDLAFCGYKSTDYELSPPMWWRP